MFYICSHRKSSDWLKRMTARDCLARRIGSPERAREPPLSGERAEKESGGHEQPVQGNCGGRRERLLRRECGFKGSRLRASERRRMEEACCLHSLPSSSARSSAGADRRSSQISLRGPAISGRPGSASSSMDSPCHAFRSPRHKCPHDRLQEIGEAPRHEAERSEQGDEPDGLQPIR
jgi:hypothetical protein